MSIRVDLMKEGEFRRQGAVSRAFVVRVSIATMIGLAALFGFLAFMRARTAKHDLIASEEIWEMRRPYYEKIQAMKQDLAKEKSLIKELEGWQRGRVTWHEQLFTLQKLVPTAMQLRRLNIRGDLDFERPAAPPKAAPGGEAKEKGKGGKKKKKKAEVSVGTPVREFSINLEGRASGRKAEDLVVQFVRLLDRSEPYRELLASIKLQSLQRDTTGGANLNDRRFVIEATTVKMRVK